ncbi:MAG: response regulator transcription factor [Megasphaera sp.]|jgi:DNA-binding response OmpR family regulator|nr:response regulator transcription factor [Megasphaera sp.]MCI1247347.1 response regulator transcription factor [Megasphaera sp.]
MEKILIADDEQLMRQLVADFLRPEGYEILEAADGKQALEIYKEEHPDLILLDVMMPGYDGWTVCREIRRESTVPIMMITAKGEEIDQLFAYDLGVDEYLTKPFSPKILVAKIKALMRRSQKEEEQDENQSEEGVSIDRNARQVVIDGKYINLSPTEYKLLNYLMINEGKALSRRQILNKVWNYEYYGDLRTVDTHINRLRIKLGDKGNLIKTVRGYGYRYDSK